MSKRTLQLQHLSAKMKAYQPLQNLAIPSTGWLKAVRSALGISLQQLGKKLQVTKQNVRMLEQREKDGTITLNTLKQTAAALDMQLVYGFVPKDGTLDELINRKALELATQIVQRTSNTMKLEDQENSGARIQKAIEEKATTFKNELPKILWD